jgi:mono/diheme cytochrome c family protein
VVARGKQIFGVNCAFCHGSDARGGEGGPNLVRSQLVLDDQKGELIIPVVQNGRPDRGMPNFPLSADDITAIATFIHSIRVTSAPEVVPASGILVGDAKAGAAYFGGSGKCNSCHSVTGDLAGIASKYDPRTLQNKLVFPLARGLGAPATKIANIPPTTVTVTLASGQKSEGALDAIDDFIVSLTDASGNHLTYRRNGDVPKVEIHDPLQAHRDMLDTISDSDVHNLTAYLETLK